MPDARIFTAHRWGPDEDYLTSWEIRSWDASEDRSLRRYWTRGLTAAVIAVKLGRSKNSIIGRARRLELAPRPSPLCRAGQPDPYPKPRTPPRQTPREAKPWPPKPAAHNSAPEPADGPRVVPPVLPSPALLVSAPEPLPPAVAIPGVPQPVAFLPVRTCQFPKGSRPNWDWCGAPTIAGGPYCAHHQMVCYARPPRWSEAA